MTFYEAVESKATEVSPLTVVAEMLCPENWSVDPHPNPLPRLRYAPRCGCLGTGLRWPSLSRKHSYYHSSGDYKTCRGAECKERGCSGFDRVPDVSLERVFVEAAKLELIKQYSFARHLLEGDKLKRSSQPHRSIVYLLELSEEERLNLACTALMSADAFSTG